MSEDLSLALTLVVLYVAECTSWVALGGAAVVARAGGRALAFPRGGLRNDRGGLVLGGLDPLRGATLLVPRWPVSIGPSGVLGWVAESLEPGARPPQSGAYRRWDELGRACADGRAVRAGGATLAEVPSTVFAERLAAELRALDALPRERRAAAVEALLDRVTDADEARGRVSAFERETRALRAASAVLAAVVLIGLPALWVLAGFRHAWAPSLAAAYAPTWIVAALFYRAHRRLLPEARLERGTDTALLALLPLSAIRAADVIGRHLLAGVHPLAAVAALLDRETIERFGGHLLRDAAHPRLPLCAFEGPEAEADERWFRAALAARLERVVRRAGIDPAALTAAPARAEAVDTGWCPRCRAQYTAKADACADCGGVTLERF